VSAGGRSGVGALRRTVLFLGEYPLILAGLILFFVFAAIQPQFVSSSNLVNILVQASVLLIASTGMTFIVMTGGIDLSVGALMFLGAAILGTTLSGISPPIVAIVLVPIVTAVVGSLNGVVVASVGVPAMIVTLASLQVFRGIGGHITEQRSSIVPDELRGAGLGDVLGIPTPIVIAVLVVVIGWYVLRRTRLGRYVQAVGSSPSAARNAGLPVKSVLIAVYAIGGLLAGVAVVVQVGRLGAVQPTLDSGFELTVITAVVLGGTSLNGGRGGIVGTALGAVILTIVENGLVLTGASPYIFDIVRGVVLLAALLTSDAPRRLLAWIQRDREEVPGATLNSSSLH
jgi:ribose/xylose/arabinose/galactoside ABC-type transport system permease subunit